MSKDIKHIEQIDEYLSNNLGTEARNEFEEKLREDSEIREELNNIKQVIEGVRGYALQETLKDIHKDLFGDEEKELTENS